MDITTNTELQMEKTLTVDQAIEAYQVWMADEFDSGDALTDGELKRLRFRLDAFSSPPSLHIEEHATAMCGDHGGIEGCSCSMCGSPLGPMELTQFCPGCGTPVDWPMADGTVVRSKGRANAHTKSVSIDRIMVLFGDCMQRNSLDRAKNDFQSGLLKLTQQ